MKRFVQTGLAALALGAASVPAVHAETAIFAGGCFWCLESDMDKVAGVTATSSGYAGGNSANPTYKTYGKGGHREVVKVEFDPSVISYGDLVRVFLRTIDPTDSGGQFCDRGFEYSPAVHALNANQAAAAKDAIAEAAQIVGKAAVPVEGAAKFWPAEDYHQDYAYSKEKQLTRFGFVTRAEAYKGYRKACGRDARVKALWGAEAYKGL